MAVQWKTTTRPAQPVAQDVTHEAEVAGMALRVQITSYGSVWLSVRCSLGGRDLVVNEYGVVNLTPEQAMARAQALAGDLLALGLAGKAGR